MSSGPAVTGSGTSRRESLEGAPKERTPIARILFVGFLWGFCVVGGARWMRVRMRMEVWLV
jgi:hypothetical protein